jgi:hypothetical protein
MILHRRTPAKCLSRPGPKAAAPREGGTSAGAWASDSEILRRRPRKRFREVVSVNFCLTRRTVRATGRC